MTASQALERPRVVGVDPSLAATGIACTHGWHELVASVGKKADSWDQRRARLRNLADRICLLVAGADLVVVEGPSYRSGDPGMFDRAHLWWSLYERWRAAGLPVAVASPASRMLYATGKGNAAKGAVFEAAKDRLSGTWASFGGDDNIADASWLAALGADWLGCPVATVPPKHRSALDKVSWPADVHR